MREIKFRAWCKIDKNHCMAYDIQDENGGGGYCFERYLKEIK